MLIDRAAAIQAIDALEADDFYLKECAYVFKAVKAVVEENLIVDPRGSQQYRGIKTPY